MIRVRVPGHTEHAHWQLPVPVAAGRRAPRIDSDSESDHESESTTCQLEPESTASLPVSGSLPVRSFNLSQSCNLNMNMTRALSLPVRPENLKWRDKGGFIRPDHGSVTLR